jgi:release factor glutamine methyltransferase
VTDRLDRGDEDRVYQPAEDTRLLAAALDGVVTAGDRVLDVGTGSGFVAMQAADLGAVVVASDVNPHACREAADRGLAVVRGDLTDPFSPGAFDVVTFNPPYLPTDPADEREDWLERALSGGESGRAVIEPFLDDVGRVLAPGGTVLLLVSTLSDLDAVKSYAADRGLAGPVIAEDSFPFERLVVLELGRDDTPDDGCAETAHSPASRREDARSN